jgi:hypothetical protein
MAHSGAERLRRAGGLRGGTSLYGLVGRASAPQHGSTRIDPGSTDDCGSAAGSGDRTRADVRGDRASGDGVPDGADFDTDTDTDTDTDADDGRVDRAADRPADATAADLGSADGDADSVATVPDVDPGAYGRSAPDAAPNVRIGGTHGRTDQAADGDQDT